MSRIPKCSFCSIQGHNLTFCVNPMIGILFERIKVIYIDVLNSYSDSQAIELRFKEVLNRRMNLRDLRAVGVKFLNLSSRLSKENLINEFYNYYRGRISSSVSLFPSSPDPIPSFANDLEVSNEILSESASQVASTSQETPITWYTDRTPDASLILRFQVLLMEQSIRNNIYNEMIEYHNNIYHANILNSLRTNLLSEFNSVDSSPKFNIKIEYGEEIELENKETEKVNEENDLKECGICWEQFSDKKLIKLNCAHEFCGDCVKGILKNHKNMIENPRCALCRDQMCVLKIVRKEEYDLLSEHCNV